MPGSWQRPRAPPARAALSSPVVSRIELYTTDRCSFGGLLVRAKDLLSERGIAFDEVFIGRDDLDGHMALARRTGMTTMPQRGRRRPGPRRLGRPGPPRGDRPPAGGARGPLSARLRPGGRRRWARRAPRWPGAPRRGPRRPRPRRRPPRTRRARPAAAPWPGRSTTSPSNGVCTGDTARHTPAVAIRATCAASALPSRPSVATTASVVCWRCGQARVRRRLGQRLVPGRAHEAAGPAPRPRPAPPPRSSSTSPKALTTARAATVVPSRRRTLAAPRPPLHHPSWPRSLPTVAPVPAPTLPTGVGRAVSSRPRRRRTASSGPARRAVCRRCRGRR